MVAGTYLRESGFNWSGLYIADGLQRTFDPYCNMWRRDAVYNSIRYCNTFLEKVWGVYNMTDAEKKLWVAEIKALKAYYYFELLLSLRTFCCDGREYRSGCSGRGYEKGKKSGGCLC